MAKHPFVRRGRALVPTTQDGRDAVNALEEGQRVMVAVTPARNVRQFCLFWAACQVVAEATDTTKDSVKDWLLLKLNYSEPIFYPDGTMRIVTKSIAWENMPQDEFETFFDAAILKMSELLAVAPTELRQRFDDLLDPETRADMRGFDRRRRSREARRANIQARPANPARRATG
jgi:hypothetical protein